MKPSQFTVVSVVVLAIITSAAPSLRAQQKTGAPCSADATTTVDPKYVPPPPQDFRGEINMDAKNSKPCWPARVVPPKGAPNVLLIMTDDQGYGISSTFGGVIPTPTLDRIAKAGLRFTQFHSTSLCSPSRAALLTGRNHHSVGFGVIAEQATGFPGYDADIGLNNASIGEILKESGYATSWFGKNHNTPGYQYSLSGPFDQWPSGMGFEYFYGFMGGESDQWKPWLFQDHTQIFPWVGHPGLQPHHRHGGRGDQAHQGAERRRARSAIPRLLRARRHRMHRISRRRSGSRRSATCTCSTKAGTSCASRSSPIRSGSA